MIRQSLNGPWIMTGENGKKWETAVPGTVLNTLLEHGEIPDPFDGMNEWDVCARMKETFTFERGFQITEEMRARKHLELVFEGIDTLADVELNGRKIAATDNMHRTWRMDIREDAVTGENRLRVIFHPTLPVVEKATKENPDITYYPCGLGQWTGCIRKAHYMYGWDWGPVLPDAGLWREVKLEAYDSRLEQIHVHQEHAEGKVTLQIRADTEAETVRFTLRDPEGAPVSEKTAKGGETAEIRIGNPRLWWPNGLGDQPLYTLETEAADGAGEPDRKTLRIGLRTMTVSTGKDEWGEEFAFCCNGEKFFAMGADYIPEDNLLTRVTRERTEQLLRDCRDANYNCVRVWGGGCYPGDDFFDLCDEMGLVVWQDLMFACNIYKLTDSFRESIIREAEDNIRRFRHHACLGLICGNNEMEMGWDVWPKVKDAPEYLRQDYLEQFEKILKEVSLREAPDSFYWPSSPSSGGGIDQPNDLNRGDVHDWSVWHGRRPFSDFTERYPRFCSEFGFESFPCMDTIRTFIHEERDMNPFSEVMESHQKCLSGNGTMLYYLAQTLKYPFSMEGLVHATQYLQAEAMRAGVEHWRRNRGRCMGAIYWQVNDCWPVASWASIDSLGRWKALHYTAKRFFAPVMVSLRKQEDGYGVVVSNERREDFRGTVSCTVRDAAGNVIREESFRADCPAMSAAEAGVVRGEFAEMPVVRCVLRDENGAAVSENEALNTLPKHFPYAETRVYTECRGKEITVWADAFCQAVELEAGDARFSDNWFSLYPGEKRTIRADREIRKEELKTRHLE